MAGDDPVTARLYWAAIVLAAVGLFARFAWPGGDTGAALGYGLTVLAILVVVVVVRRTRTGDDGA